MLETSSNILVSLVHYRIEEELSGEEARRLLVNAMISMV